MYKSYTSEVVAVRKEGHRPSSPQNRAFFVDEDAINCEGTDIINNLDPEVYARRFVFEIAWEVANKVGGIYTVIRTKAKVTSLELGNRYLLLGPLNETCMRGEVDQCDSEVPAVMFAINDMRSNGLKVVGGKWLVEGCPYVVLFDIGSAKSHLIEWKNELWNSSKIGIPVNDQESNDSVVFGALVTWFIGVFRAKMNDLSRDYVPLIAHFHEWLSGAGLIFCRTRQVDVATVFSTHATLLGRYLSASSVDLYNNLSTFEIDKEAGDRQIYHRYCIERAATHCAHTFTVVSKVTGLEAQYLLHRKPDVITPNGLDIPQFTAIHEFQNRHSIAKDKIQRFIQNHFYGFLDFDLEKTIYFFTAGRYEFMNKGADMFIESLARLNYQLKTSNSDVTVVAFLIFPAKTNNFNIETFRSQAIVKQMRDTVGDIQRSVGMKMFDSCLRGTVPSSIDMFDKDDIMKLKRCVFAAQRFTLPPICTHNVVDDNVDLVLCNLRRCKLFNNRSDRVKVIFHPEFLTSTNPLIAMDYDEFARGCHLGVFPSYYEPWGYTPAECTVMGIPSVTTNLSGFGCFMEEHLEDPKSYGIYVIDRRFKSGEESINQLTDYLFEFSHYSRRQRIILRNRTERLSELLDWSNLTFYYRKARLLAMARHLPHLFRDPKESDSNIDHKKPSSQSEVFSERSWHLLRPYSAPNSPSLSENLEHEAPDYQDDDFDKLETDVVDDNKELLELGLSKSADEVHQHSGMDLLSSMQRSK